VKKLLAGLRACEGQLNLAKCQVAFPCNCTVAALTRAFAYRCGGSDGIAELRRTIFPFNPLAEQPEGHLQTSFEG
jgi:hypothetical protein